MKIPPGKAASITSLLLLLFFPNFLVLLGYTVNESIFLGIVAGVSGGLIAGWSHTEPEEKKLEEAEAKAEEGEKTELETTQASGDSSSVEEEKNNEDVSDKDPSAYSLPREIREKYNINNRDRTTQLPKNYELTFIDSVSPKEDEKAEDKSSEENDDNFQKSAKKMSEASSRARRKGVSLFSWFLMKEGGSSKSHRR
ncbi:MAG: hypothetical protein SXA11_17265 [Cyanobacteriota bacterium]|nr:hypothetical protein [Cyanobacteriota bacterium]